MPASAATAVQGACPMLALLMATVPLCTGYTCDSTVPCNETNTLPYGERGPVSCFQLQLLADEDDDFILDSIDGERVANTSRMYYRETELAVNLSLCNGYPGKRAHK